MVQQVNDQVNVLAELSSIDKFNKAIAYAKTRRRDMVFRCRATGGYSNVCFVKG